ncbi:MAG: linear amide C-N hydrolase [Fimbriiglobus sp.]
MTAPRNGTACTGVTLKANDGAVVYGRTMEWGAFDLNSQVVIFPADTGSRHTPRTRNPV